MPSGPFISYAQNAEDVVLWRALGHLGAGCYIDVGAFDPVVHSVTKQLYDAGWRGINLEPVPDLHAAMVVGRPEDVNLQLAAGAEPGTLAFHIVTDTGLSTLRGAIAAHHAGDGRQVQVIEVQVVTLDTLIAEHLGGQQVHVLKVDVEGAEADVLAGIDLVTNRPWVLVVEATLPLTSEPTHDGWEPDLLARGYEFCLFDGLSRWYVAAEHSQRLRPALCYPACVLDNYEPVEMSSARGRADRVGRQLEVWREEALEHAVLERNLQLQLLDIQDEVARARLLINDFAVAKAELAEARWHGDLLDKERVWLRGLLAEQGAALDRQLADSKLGPVALAGPARRAVRALRRLSAPRAT